MLAHDRLATAFRDLYDQGGVAFAWFCRRDFTVLPDARAALFYHYPCILVSCLALANWSSPRYSLVPLL